MGWSIAADREKFTLEEMVEKFDLDRVSTGEPVFDLVKLIDLNGQYIRELSPAQLVERITAWKLSKDYLGKVAPLFLERIKTLSDFVAQSDFFFTGDLDLKVVGEAIVPKGKTPQETADVLLEYVEKLDEPVASTSGGPAQRVDFTDKALEEFSRAFCEKSGWKPKELFGAVRQSLTGKTATPPLFAAMEVLGREMVRKRLRNAVEYLRTLKPATPPAPAQPKQ
jgi:glutamyl-tRNA synthetase